MHMHMRSNARALAVVASVAAGLVGGTAQAQSNYPTKPISLYVGFSAGSTIDITARQIQPFLEKYIGNNARIAVVNKPGAGGAIANSTVATAAPDGYTLGFLSLPGLFTILFGADYQYDVDSFEYLGTVTSEPYTIYVSPNSPYKTFKDMVAKLKAEPGSVSIAGSGIGSAPHLAALVTQKVAGVKFNYVPVKGSNKGIAAVMGGHMDAGITSVSGTATRYKEGQLGVLGVMGAERVSVAKDIPTFAEQGYDIEWGATRGIGAPKGTPADIVKQLSDAISKLHSDPEFLKIANEHGMILHKGSAAAFTKMAHEQYNMAADMWKENPWKQ